MNQYNVFSVRKRNDSAQFYSKTYKKSKEKMWVMEQFERLASQFSWNENLSEIVPIIPALHGSDLQIAGN